jgi:hypothetical protein
VHESIASHLSAWESYYVIVGSSAAALTGLQFVVIALVAETERVSSGPREISAFGTPTVVHFCAALLIAATLSAPWNRLGSAGIGIGATGAVGVAYAVIITRRARRQTGYQPVLEDWIWHTVLPFVGYGSLVLAALFLHHHPPESLFVIGAVALLLVFIGIHNAWDTVTYIAISRDQPAEKPTPPTS